MRSGLNARWMLALSALLVWCGAMALPGLAVAQDDAALRALRERAEARFQVVVLKRGIVLVPKETQPSYANIEVNDEGAVLVDGAPVTGRELRGRLAGDADVVTQLSFLSASQRRSLFTREVPDAPADATPSPAPEPDAPAVRESVPSDTADEDARMRRRGGGRVRVGGDVRVAEGESAGDAVVAVFGAAYVDGRVDGDVVAVGGSVHLGPKSDVRGNAVAVGGEVEHEPGAKVWGEISEVRVGFPSMGPWIRIRPWQGWHWFRDGVGAPGDLLTSLLRMAVLGVFTVMLVAVAGTPVRRISSTVATDPWRAGLTGLAAQVFFVPVLVISVVVLAVSIVGIPLLLLVPFALLACVFGLFLGFAGASCAIGGLVTRQAGRSRLTLLATCVVGLAVIFALTGIARFAGLAGQPIRTVVGVVLLAGFIVEYIAWTMGLGAVLMTRFGRRGPAAPPVPPVPFVDDDLPSSAV